MSSDLPSNCSERRGKLFNEPGINIDSNSSASFVSMAKKELVDSLYDSSSLLFVCNASAREQQTNYRD